MHLKWAKNIPAFLIIAVFLLFLADINSIINIFIISGVVILLVLEIIYFWKLKNSRFAYSAVNRATSFIMIPTIALFLFLLVFGTLYAFLRYAGKDMFRNQNPGFINIRRHTNFQNIYPHKADRVIINVLSEDIEKEEFYVETVLEFDSVWYGSSSISFKEEYDELVTTTLKYVYIDDTLKEAEYDSENKTYIYSYDIEEGSPEYFKLKLVYESRVKYAKIDEYKGFGLILYGSQKDNIILSSDYRYEDRIKLAARNYLIVSADTPGKYTSGRTLVYKGIQEALIPVYAISGIVVLLKGITFIVYKIKNKEGDTNESS